MSGRLWSQEEIDFVLTNSDTMSMKQIAEKIGRTESAVQYGGRGISITQDWEDAGAFVRWAHTNGFQPGLTLDRKDNELGYSPENCIWSTHLEQANNRSTNRKLTIGGITKNVSEWAKDPIAKVGEQTIRYRINHDWSDEDAVTTPNTKSSRN